MTYSKDPRQRAKQVISDLAEITSTEHGRRFMHWLIEEKCLLHGTVFTGNSGTYYRAGRRDVGGEIRRLWKAANLASLQTAERENYEMAQLTRKGPNHGGSGDNPNSDADE